MKRLFIYVFDFVHDMYKKNPLLFIALSVIFLLVASAHFLYLNTLLPSLTHDEVEYTLSSKTFALFGKDLSGYSFPLSLFNTETEGWISPLPYILLAPLRLFLPLTQATARLPYVFIHLATAGVLFAFVYILLRNKWYSLMASLLFMLSPWAFYLSRTATESPFALLFYLLGITLLIRGKGWWLVSAFVFFVMGFFSYHGAKPLLIPVILGCLFYRWQQLKTVYFNFSSKKESLKLTTHFVQFPLLFWPKSQGKRVQSGQLCFEWESLLFLMGIIIVAASFLVITQIIHSHITSSRLSEVFFLDQATISQTVNQKRQLTIANPFLSLGINKLSVIGNTFFEKYLGAFSPEVLFISGDSRIIYSFLEHGLLYLFDGILILAGLLALFVKKRSVFYFLLFLICIAPLSSAINAKGTSYVHRSFLLLPLYMSCAGVGIVEVYLFLRKYLAGMISGGILALILVYSFSSFLFFYFYHYPVIASESYSLSDRLVAKFLQESEKQSANKLLVAAVNPRDTYLESIFYSPDQKGLTHHMNQVTAFNNGTYTTASTSFLYDCPPDPDKNTTYIIRVDKLCYPHQLSPVYTLRNPKDSGVEYAIYTSSLCQNVPLGSYLKTRNVADYSIESMDRKTFCERWVTLP